MGGVALVSANTTGGMTTVGSLFAQLSVALAQASVNAKRLHKHRACDEKRSSMKPR